MASNREAVTFGHLLECHPGYFRNLDLADEGPEPWHTNEEESAEVDDLLEGLWLRGWYESRTERAAPVGRMYFGTFRLFRFQVNGTWYEQLEMVSPGEWDMPETETLSGAEMLSEMRQEYARFDQKYDLSKPEDRAEVEKIIADDQAKEEAYGQ